MSKKRIASALVAVSCLVLGACSSDNKTASASTDKAMAVAADNTQCPISHNAVNASAGTVDFNGKHVGFCCNGCKDKFTKADDAKKAELVTNLK